MRQQPHQHQMPDHNWLCCQTQLHWIQRRRHCIPCTQMVNEIGAILWIQCNHENHDCTTLTKIFVLFWCVRMNSWIFLQSITCWDVVWYSMNLLHKWTVSNTSSMCHAPRWFQQYHQFLFDCLIGEIATTEVIGSSDCKITLLGKFVISW